MSGGARVVMKRKELVRVEHICFTRLSRCCKAL